MTIGGDAARPWTPPIWLRKVGAAAAEHRREAAAMSPTERFRLACELISFSLDRLEEQAARRGCSVSELLATYEQAAARLRARD